MKQKRCPLQTQIFKILLSDSRLKKDFPTKQLSTFLVWGNKKIFQVSTKSKHTDTRHSKDTPKCMPSDFYYTYYNHIRFDKRFFFQIVEKSLSTFFFKTQSKITAALCFLSCFFSFHSRKAKQKKFMLGKNFFEKLFWTSEGLHARHIVPMGKKRTHNGKNFGPHTQQCLMQPLF